MNNQTQIPDHTAVRVALWRALHVQVDAAPHVLEDEVGLRLIAPDESWKQRGDMHPQGTRGYRASIVGRARFLEDLVAEQLKLGVHQYVILGAGLDTFAQRKPQIAAQLKIYEVEKTATQNWKKQRLMDLGYGIPEYLKFVPVDFEASESWWDKLIANGFDAKKPAVISSTGVSMYLTKEAITATLRQVAKLAPGSTFAMTFMLPLELLPESERPGHQMVYERAKAAGTPFLSFFRPEEIVALAKECGFKKASYFGTTDLINKYFKGRSDGLVPSEGECVLVAET